MSYVYLINCLGDSIIPKESVYIEDKWRIDAIAEVMRKGGTLEMASRCARIDYDTLRRWMKKGREQLNLPEDQRDKYFLIYAEIKKAQADGAVELLECIRNQSSKQWQAAAWILERRYHKEFGKKIVVENSDPVHGNSLIQHDTADEDVNIAYKRMSNKTSLDEEEEED